MNVDTEHERVLVAVETEHKGGFSTARELEVTVHDHQLTSHADVSTSD